MPSARDADVWPAASEHGAKGAGPRVPPASTLQTNVTSGSSAVNAKVGVRSEVVSPSSGPSVISMPEGGRRR